MSFLEFDKIGNIRLFNAHWKYSTFFPFETLRFGFDLRFFFGSLNKKKATVFLCFARICLRIYNAAYICTCDAQKVSILNNIRRHHICGIYFAVFAVTGRACKNVFRVMYLYNSIHERGTKNTGVLYSAKIKMQNFIYFTQWWASALRLVHKKKMCKRNFFYDRYFALTEKK